jgi:hypothetical protein
MLFMDKSNVNDSYGLSCAIGMPSFDCLLFFFGLKIMVSTANVISR